MSQPTTSQLELGRTYFYELIEQPDGGKQWEITDEDGNLVQSGDLEA